MKIVYGVLMLAAVFSMTASINRLNKDIKKTETPATTQNSSKFKAGDCVRTSRVLEADEDYEFIKEEPYVLVLEYRVIAVGKKKYHLQYHEKGFTERLIEYIDEEGKLINCNEVEF